MDVQCLKVKLKEGMTEYVIDWMKKLYSKMDLVYDALISEAMIVESIFLDRCKDGDYLIFYTRAKSLQKANEMMIISENPVDKEALAMINKTWESAQPLEVLFDADIIEKIRRADQKKDR